MGKVQDLNSHFSCCLENKMMYPGDRAERCQTELDRDLSAGPCTAEFRVLPFSSITPFSMNSPLGNFSAASHGLQTRVQTYSDPLQNKRNTHSRPSWFSLPSMLMPFLIENIARTK